MEPGADTRRDIEAIRLEKLRLKLASALRARYIILPLLLTLWGLLAIVGMETWRHVCIGGLIGLMITIFVAFDLSRRDTPRPTPQHLRLFFPFIACLHGFIILLTGGLFSPALPVLLVLMMVAGNYWRSIEKAIAAPLTATLVLIGLALVDGMGWIPSLPGLAPPNPSPAALAALALAMIALCWITLTVSVALAQAHDGTARALDSAYVQLLDAHQERLESLEGVTNRVAHEIKNPLSAIKGLNQLLLRKGDPTGHLQVIADEIVRIEGILGELRSFAHPIDHRRVERVELCAHARQVLALLEARLGESGVRASVLGPAQGAFVEADPRALTQILLNVLLNAVEAMEVAAAEPRSLAIDVAATEQGARITVRDSGPGLTGGIGDPFRPGASTKPTGTGLGLPISRAMARAHGGELTLSQAAEGGAIATLTLPSHPPTPPTRSEP